MYNDETRAIMYGGMAFLAGFVLGVGTGVVLAPQSGARTRRQLQNWAEDIGERASAMAEDAKQAATKILK
jgi:gas vesicle protein